MKLETNGRGYFRKSKAYGLVCGIALTGAFALSGGQVFADEAVTEVPTEQVAQTTDVANAGTEEITSDIPTSVPSNTTQNQAVETVDKAQDTLKDNVAQATEAGVVVKEGETEEVVINDGNVVEKTNEVLTDLNKQDQAVKEATAKHLDNVKAYEETTKALEEAVTKGQEDLTKSTSEVDKLMEEAKKAGLVVNETTTDMTPEYKDVKGLTGDDLRQAMAENIDLYKKAIEAGIVIQGKSVEELKRALELYITNQKAYTESKTIRGLAVSEGQATLEKATSALNEQIEIAKKNGLTVNETTTDNTPTYKDTKGLTGDALKSAMEENVKLYNEAVKASSDLITGSTAQMKEQIDAYVLAMADYQKGISTNTGLKWQDGVTVSAGNGAKKMTGAEQVVDAYIYGDGSLKTAAMYATQSGYFNQNTDANFDNIFKINGTGTITVKNTTNGDVTLTFSEIDSPLNTGTYVAIWGANDGGIAWSVFATYTGEAVGGTGEEAGGGSGLGGKILNYVHSYKVNVKTANDVSVVTFNDIDVEQNINVAGLDGATISKGKNITGETTSFTGTPGELTQASSGILDSNGVGWTFDAAKKQNFTIVHSVPTNNTSIVGGIFGVASEKPKEPEAPTLEAKKATVKAPDAPEAPETISVSVNKVTVEAPEAPEEPQPIEVEVHYYKMKTTPSTPSSPSTPTEETPVAKGNVLPNTGDSSSIMGVMTGLVTTLSSTLGMMGLKKRK